MVNQWTAIAVGMSLATTHAIEFCTDLASATAWGIELDPVDLTDQETLEFYTIGDWGVINCTRDDCVDAWGIEFSNVFGDYVSQNDGEFILGLGDNFYQFGMSLDLLYRWNMTFEDHFNATSLLDLYFYNVLGNHDWEKANGNPYRDNETSSLWDIGTRLQINYTSAPNLNKNKRWCLPSYYYTFRYQLKSFNVQFIALDGITLLPYEEKGCRPKQNNSNVVNDWCHGESLPSYSDQWEWFTSLLEDISDENNDNSSNPTSVVIYSHFPIVSAGSYGLLNIELHPKCDNYFGGYQTFSKNISHLVGKYDFIQLYMSGHEHNTELFLGNVTTTTDSSSSIVIDSDNNNNNNNEILSVLTDSSDNNVLAVITGASGKNSSYICGNQTDIDEQFNNNPELDLNIEWTLKYNKKDLGFSHVIFSEESINVRLFDMDQNVVVQATIDNNLYDEILNATTNADPNDTDKAIGRLVNDWQMFIICVTICLTIFLA